MKWAALFLSLLCASCARYDLGLELTGLDQLDAARVELSVFVPGEPIEDACDRFAYGQLDPQTLASALTEFSNDLLKDPAALEVPRAGQKILILRVFDDEEREIGRGCAAPEEVPRGGQTVEVALEPVSFLELVAQREGEFDILVIDVDGAPATDVDVRITVCQATCTSEERLFTPGINGTQLIAPVIPEVGPYSVDIQSRHGLKIRGEGGVNASGLSIDLEEKVDGMASRLRLPVTVGDRAGFFGWRVPTLADPGFIELTLFDDDGELEAPVQSVAGVVGPLLSVGPSGERVIPVARSDGQLMLMNERLEVDEFAADLGFTWSPSDGPAPTVNGSFAAGPCGVSRPRSFFVTVTEFEQPQVLRGVNVVAPNNGGANVIGTSCFDVGEGPERFVELEDDNGRAFLRLATAEFVVMSTFRTASVQREGPGGPEEVVAHLVPPANLFRVDRLDIRDAGGAEIVTAASEGPSVPGLITQMVAGHLTEASRVSGVEDVVYIAGEVELFPEFRLLNRVWIGLIEGELEAPRATFVEVPECEVLVGCFLELADVDDDGVDEVLLARSTTSVNFLASSFVIDLSP